MTAAAASCSSGTTTRELTIRHRLEVYADQTSPLIGYYGDRGLLSGVDATGPVEDVTERAINALRRFGD